MKLLSFASMAQYQRYLQEQSETLGACWQAWQQLDQHCTSPGILPGWCTLCRQPTEFSYQTGGRANLREELDCRRCQLKARVRFAFTLLGARFATPSRLYITEQISPAYHWLHRRYTQVTGSEYFSREHQWSWRTWWLRFRLRFRLRLQHQDVTRLTFADQSFDGIISFDVLEHVPDFRQALHEFARVSRPGGFLILTVPFMETNQYTIQRATVNAHGQAEHLLEPEYHADALRTRGALAYHNFSWDLLDALRDAGFHEVECCTSWDLPSGYPGNVWTIVARRKRH